MWQKIKQFFSKNKMQCPPCKNRKECPQGIQQLTMLSEGTRCRVCKIRSEGAMRQRLLDLGIVPNSEITLLRAAPLRDPLELQVGRAFVSLRRIEAEKIEVEPI